MYKIVEEQEDWLGKGLMVGVDNGVLDWGCSDYVQQEVN